MNNNKIYTLNPGFIHKKITDVDVLISVGQNVASFNGYMELNGTAAHIYDALKEEKSESELVNGILELYDIDRETAESDVHEYLNQLIKEGMVSECP